LDLLIRLSAEYGVLVVFGTVLLEQLGVPIPAYPVLLLTAGLATRGNTGVWQLLAAAVFASVLADSAWFLAGKRYGRRVLGLLCRISLTPDSCVRQTETIFTRWGAPSLLVAKFVPGFASIATALAGAMRISRGSFLVYDTIGAIAWAGLGLGLGVLFSDAIEEIMQSLEQIGRWGLLLVATAVALFVLRKWWQRRAFSRQLKMDRLTVEDLLAFMDRGERLVIVDARSVGGWAEGRIPGAISFASDVCADHLRDHPKDSLVVVYCACPNDASAVVTAKKLMEGGFKRVLPLAGGIDAWLAAGGAVER